MDVRLTGCVPAVQKFRVLAYCLTWLFDLRIFAWKGEWFLEMFELEEAEMLLPGPLIPRPWS